MTATIKTGLMYSPLTSKVYWGRMNTKSGVVVGNNKKDITSDFIGVMLQKFTINTSQNVTSNGKLECVVMVLDDKKCHKYMAANDMYDLLSTIENDNNQVPEWLWDKIQSVLAKARGEK